MLHLFEKQWELNQRTICQEKSMKLFPGVECRVFPFLLLFVSADGLLTADQTNSAVENKKKKKKGGRKREKKFILGGLLGRKSRRASTTRVLIT